MRSFAVLAVMLVGAGVCWGQDDDKKTEEKPKPSANLDTKKIDVTALYLCNVSLKLQQLSAEALKTGNHTKFNEYQSKINNELSTWKGADIKWIIQVDSVNQNRKNEIEPIQEYAYKNKSKLSIDLSGFGFGFGGALVNGVSSSSSRDGSRGGIGGIGGVNEKDTVEYDKTWAKTMKRGDFMVVEGTIEHVYIRGGGEIPSISINPKKLSAYSPPKKK